MTSLELVLLALLGGVVALDTTSEGQFMLSRPLVTGVLAGWIVGAPGQGLLVGGVLEVVYIMIFPIGGGRFPEAGPGAVVAVAAAVLAMAEAGGTGAGLAGGVLLGVVWSHLGGLSVGVQRHLNGRIAPDPYHGGGLLPGAVVRDHLTAIGLDFLRGLLLTGAGLVAATFLAPLLGRSWPLEGSATLGLLLVAAGVPLGILMRSFGGFRKRGLLFASGLVVGVLGAVLL